jgi:glycosyltransferase involved in cell wall biosynthesis
MSGREAVRVLWLTKGLGLGGTERILSMGTGALDPERYSVDVAFVLSHKSALVAELRLTGTPVHDLGAAPGRFGWVLALARLLHGSRYSIVHTHSPVPAIVARLLPLRQRPAFVHTEHSAWERYRLPTRVLNSLTMRRNDSLIAVSESVAHSMRSSRIRRLLTASEPRVIYHGIDEAAARSGPEARQLAREALGFGDEIRLIGTVGSLTPKKDQATLIRALTLCDSTVRLIIIGDGPLREELRNLVMRLGLVERVSFLGVRDDVQRLLPALDLFVLPSQHEGLGLVLLEAMAAGICCIGTRVGGIPEVIQDGLNGVLVPPADPAAMATAIDLLLEDRERCRQFAEAAKATVSSFSIARAMAEVADVYDALQRGRS